MSVGCLTDCLPFLGGVGWGAGKKGGVSGRVKGHHCAEPDVTLQSQMSFCRARRHFAEPDITVQSQTSLCRARHHCAEPDVTLQSQTSLCRARRHFAEPDITVQSQNRNGR